MPRTRSSALPDQGGQRVRAAEHRGGDVGGGVVDDVRRRRRPHHHQADAADGGPVQLAPDLGALLRREVRDRRVRVVGEHALDARQRPIEGAGEPVEQLDQVERLDRARGRTRNRGVALEQPPAAGGPAEPQAGLDALAMLAEQAIHLRGWLRRIGARRGGLCRQRRRGEHVDRHTCGHVQESGGGTGHERACACREQVIAKARCCRRLVPSPRDGS